MLCQFVEVIQLEFNPLNPPSVRGALNHNIVPSSFIKKLQTPLLFPPFRAGARGDFQSLK